MRVTTSATSRVSSFASRPWTTLNSSTRLNSKRPTTRSASKYPNSPNDSSYLTELSQTEDVSERDGILLWNLMPASYDEAVALVPTLTKANKEKVSRYIEFLNDKRGACKV